MLYLVRVQLNSVGEQRPSYTSLHTHMVAAGFRRVIRVRSGDLKRLPRGTYILSAVVGIADVLHEAEVAAANYWSEVEVVVAEARCLRMSGLQPASVAEERIWRSEIPLLVEQ